MPEREAVGGNRVTHQGKGLHILTWTPQSREERVNKGCSGRGVTLRFPQVIDILRGKASRAASGSQPEPSPDQSATTSPESAGHLSANGESALRPSGP